MHMELMYVGSTLVECMHTELMHVELMLAAFVCEIDAHGVAVRGIHVHGGPVRTYLET